MIRDKRMIVEIQWYRQSVWVFEPTKKKKKAITCTNCYLREKEKEKDYKMRRTPQRSCLIVNTEESSSAAFLLFVGIRRRGHLWFRVLLYSQRQKTTD